MTKQTLRGLAAAFAVLVVGYLFGAFVAADWNTAHWGTDAKVLLGVIVLFLASIIFALTSYDH